MLSSQEKPELHSWYLAVVLHPFCTWSSVPKKTALCLFTEQEELTSWQESELVENPRSVSLLLTPEYSYCTSAWCQLLPLSRTGDLVFADKR